MSETLSIIIIVICLILSAYFSASETAFSTFNKIKIKNLADKGNRKAKLVLNISENYDTMLSTILIGNNIVNILSASLATILFPVDVEIFDAACHIGFRHIHHVIVLF